MSIKKSWKKILFAAGVLIFLYMIYAIGIDAIWGNIKQTGWWFIPIIGIWVVVYTINALAWYSIICDKRGQRPSFLKIFKITISGYAINYITPMIALGGEPYRILETQKELGTQRATSSVLSYSMMHILSHFVFWICSILLILLLLKPVWWLRMGCMLMFCLFTFVLYLIFKGYKKGLVAKTFRILEKVPFIRKPVKKFSEKNAESFRDIDQNIVHLYTERKPTFFLALGLEFLARTISCLEIFFITKAIGIDITFMDSILIYAGSSLFANILFFSPMQLGTREGGLALSLKTMGLQASLGVYMGLVMRVRELFWIGIGMLLVKIKKRNKMKETTHFPTNIKGIIFDYGGTLDTNGIHWFEVFCKAYLSVGVLVRKESLRDAYIFGEQEMERNSREILPEDTFRDNLAKKVGYQIDYLLREENLNVLQEKDLIVAYCYDFAKQNVSESANVLAALSQEYPLVLVSNFYGNLPSVLKDFGIDTYFQSVVESAAVGIRKPDTEIFQKGIDGLGLNPNQVAVVGDSYVNDIAPAKKLGCIAVWLKGIGWDSADNKEHFSDYTIGNLKETLSLVNKEIRE